ncbi:hypothetical protein E4U54_003855, partial [Claviceps lovelessii]
LADLLSSPALIDALAHAPSSAHESTRSSHALLTAALQHNSHLATQLSAAASRLSHQRSTTQAQLLATHALERQWRQKQADMDHALAPFSPASLYQQLGQGVQEQGYVCEALEESFLEGERGDGAGAAEERDLAEWVRRYREARVLWYLRRERRERWDEGRRQTNMTRSNRAVSSTHGLPRRQASASAAPRDAVIKITRGMPLQATGHSQSQSGGQMYARSTI